MNNLSTIKRKSGSSFASPVITNSANILNLISNNNGGNYANQNYNNSLASGNLSTNNDNFYSNFVPKNIFGAKPVSASSLNRNFEGVREGMD